MELGGGRNHERGRCCLRLGGKPKEAESRLSLLRTNWMINGQSLPRCPCHLSALASSMLCVADAEVLNPRGPQTCPAGPWLCPSALPDGAAFGRRGNAQACIFTVTEVFFIAKVFFYFSFPHVCYLKCLSVSGVLCVLFLSLKYQLPCS